MASAKKAFQIGPELILTATKFRKSLGLTKEQYLAANSFKLKRKGVLLNGRVGDIMVNAFNVDILKLLASKHGYPASS